MNYSRGHRPTETPEGARISPPWLQYSNDNIYTPLLNNIISIIIYYMVTKYHVPLYCLYYRRVSFNGVLEDDDDPRGITVSCLPNAWCALVIPGVRDISDGLWYCTGRDVTNTLVEILGIYIFISIGHTNAVFSKRFLDGKSDLPRSKRRVSSTLLLCELNQICP